MSHVFERISHINDIQSHLTGSPLAMNLESVQSRNVFNIFTVFEKERYQASITVSSHDWIADGDGRGNCSQAGHV
jgi:hypothetical protein